MKWNGIRLDICGTSNTPNQIMIFGIDWEFFVRYRESFQTMTYHVKQNPMKQIKSNQIKTKKAKIIETKQKHDEIPVK